MKLLHLLHCLTVLIGLLAVTATARPCKTIFISSFSFTTTTTTTTTSSNPNPNTNPNSPRFFAIITEIHNRNDQNAPRFLDMLHPVPLPKIYPARYHYGDDLEFVKPANREEQQQVKRESVFPFGLFRYDTSSIGDRTKDILSIVVALLFGVGCGSLTAATMYLIWSLFFPRYDYYYHNGDYFETGDDSDVDSDDIYSPKKYGYVNVPDAASAAKEVV